MPLNCALTTVKVVRFLLCTLCHYWEKRLYKLNYAPLAFKRLSGQERLREMGEREGKKEGGREERDGVSSCHKYLNSCLSPSLF